MDKKTIKDLLLIAYAHAASNAASNAAAHAASHAASNAASRAASNSVSVASPCESGWRKLLTHLGKTKADDEPLPYSFLLYSRAT